MSGMDDIKEEISKLLYQWQRDDFDKDTASRLILKKISDFLDQRQGDDLDQDVAYLLELKKLLETKIKEDEQRKLKRRNFRNALTTSFNLLFLSLVVAGFVHLNVKTAQYYIGLSTVEFFIEKSSSNVCNYGRCVKPGTNKKTYHLYGIGVGKGTAHYYCDEHIKEAPKTLGSFAPLLAKLVFLISLVGLSGSYIVVLLKAYGSAVKRDDFFNWLAILLLVSAGLYLIPTLFTFLM